MALTILTFIFFVSLLFGQFGSVSLLPGITVYLHDIVLVLMVLIHGLFSFRQKKPISAVLVKPLALFVGIGIISLLINSYRFSLREIVISSLYLWRWALYACLYWVVSTSNIPVKIWQWCLYGCGVVLAIIGLLQLVFFPSLKSMQAMGWDEHFRRLFSTFLDPNFIGIFLVLSFLFGVYLFSNRTHRSLLWVTQSILVMAIIFTYSRSTYLAFTGAIVMWSILSRKVKILLVLGVGILVYLLIPKTAFDGNRLDRRDSSVARIINWEQSITRFSQAPLFGHGFDTLRYLAAREKAVDYLGIPSRDAAGVNSSILFVLITTGLVGGAVYLWLFYNEVLLFWFSPFRLVAVSVTVALLIHSLFNNSLFYAWMMIWEWIFMGIIEKSIRKGKKKVTSGTSHGG